MFFLCFLFTFVLSRKWQHFDDNNLDIFIRIFHNMYSTHYASTDKKWESKRKIPRNNVPRALW